MIRLFFSYSKEGTEVIGTIEATPLISNIKKSGKAATTEAHRIFNFQNYR